MAFSGFTTEATKFFDALADNNNRTFFTEHRDTYDRAIRQPLEDLLGEVQDRYGAGRVMRPNRDVRFSKDKSPYKVNAALWAGEVGGVYLSVSAQGLAVGGGLYEPARDQLERARRAIDGQPRAAAELEKVREALVDAGFEFAGPFLKTAPRGYDTDHPHIELLRLKHFAALTNLPITANRARILDAWGQVDPLIKWVDARIGAARDEP